MNNYNIIKRAFIGAFLAFTAVSCCNSPKATAESNPVNSIAIRDNGSEVTYYLDTLAKPFSVMFISDCHITIEDERGREYYEYSKRMGGDAAKPENYGKSNGREKALIASLEIAKEKGVELVILAGDIINFPSKASVELIKKIMDDSEIPWLFISGNHDWHYEGMEGSSKALREEWSEKSLKPLYQGANPLYSSKIVNGINFVVIDNSIFNITEEQLEFFKAQTQKSEPIVLSMHIPLYTGGQIPDCFGCGHPEWNAESDRNYKIERREKWSIEGLSKTTFDFHDLVFNSSSNVIGVFAGHTHFREINFYEGVHQFVNGANFMGDHIMINFNPDI